jgi:hypothetical protein
MHVVYLSIGKRTKEFDLWLSNIIDYWSTRKKDMHSILTGVR